jgi:hypothetical protein
MAVHEPHGLMYQKNFILITESFVSVLELYSYCRSTLSFEKVETRQAVRGTAIASWSYRKGAKKGRLGENVQTKGEYIKKGKM